MIDEKKLIKDIKHECNLNAGGLYEEDIIRIIESQPEVRRKKEKKDPNIIDFTKYNELSKRDEPKKVCVIIWDLSTNEDWDIECPNCGALLGSVEDHFKADFCWHCGQKLDWSNEE